MLETKNISHEILNFNQEELTHPSLSHKSIDLKMEDINPLKKINLEQYQKPKTLIVVHYKGKRISVPLLGDCKNLTQMLYHHIDKFEQTVLKSDPKWEVISQRKIVCFCSSPASNDKNENKSITKESNSISKNIDKFLRYPDGELKMDLLLSLIRIESNDSRPVLDITKFYKYMEIQPFYVEYPLPNIVNEKENPMKHKYYFYRLIEKNRVKNNYLARSLENGHFYSIKVYRSGLSMAEHEARFLNVINNQAQITMPEYLKQPYFSEQNLTKAEEIIGQTEIYMIPSEEEEDEEDEEVEQRYKHLAIVQKYNIKGKLSDRINDKNSRFTESDLLKYLKQLVWIVYQLHEEYNIVHRNLTPESFEIDETGDLKLTCFSSWVECHDQDGNLIEYPLSKNSSRSDYSHDSRIYEEEFEFAQDGWYNIGHYTPPEVALNSKSGYTKFVDYYTIGIIINEIYKKIYEFQNKSQSQSSLLIEKMINSLTSQNLQQREEIILELVESIKKSKLEDTERKNQQQVTLNLSEIKLGQFINLDMSQSCVENEDHDFEFNGISHQEIINYFKPRKELKESLHQNNISQIKEEKSKEKKKSTNPMKISKNEALNISNSRDKSVKSVKSNKSKDKSRTKSKLINEKGDKLEKSKSKSHKKLVSPERTSYNNGKLNANSKLTKLNDTSVTGGQKKSKSKSCEKLKLEKSPDRKSKEKKQTFNNTMSTANQRAGETLKAMSRTGVHVPLPRQNIKSPTRIT